MHGDSLSFVVFTILKLMQQSLSSQPCSNENDSFLPKRCKCHKPLFSYKIYQFFGLHLLRGLLLPLFFDEPIFFFIGIDFFQPYKAKSVRKLPNKEKSTEKNSSKQKHMNLYTLLPTITK